MATIVTRSGKGSALTHTEMDANFNNLNNEIATLATDSEVVKLTGDQTITGVKDFTGNVKLSGSQIYARSNILGTVSQSGGVPTGAIIERGSNANGNYIKYADGTLICYRKFSGSITTQATFGTFSISTPIAFISSPITSCRSAGQRVFSIRDSDGASSFTTSWFGEFRSLVNGSLLNNVTETAHFDLLAIGRWY